MSHLHFERTRTASPGLKQVAFDHKCQVIPEGDCAELRNLLSLNPSRAQSPPILGSSRPSSFIARAISPQLVRAKSPNLKKATGLGHAPPSAVTSWRTRLASWGSGSGGGENSSQPNSIDGNISAAFGPSAPSHSSNDDTSSSGNNQSSSDDGPRLVAPIAARGTPSLMIPFNDDDESVDISPSNESVIDFDDVDAEFQHAVSGKAMLRNHTPVSSIQASPSPTLQPPRSASPFVRSTSPFVRSNSELRYQRPMPGGRRKSCLVRSSTPQAPGPPRLIDDGMSPLRATRSHDRDDSFPQRRRADGVPVVCSSPLSPTHEQHGPAASAPAAEGSRSAKHQLQGLVGSEKSKLSRWRRFRRTASEDAPRVESSSSTATTSEMRLDDAGIKRQIQAGRWPFEAPLNAECSCKNCQDRIEVGLASNYEPRWTRAARIRWLEGQGEAALPSKQGASGSKLHLPRSAGRTAIQADEMAQLHNETVHPQTAAELAAHEPASPSAEKGNLVAWEAKLPNPTGLEEGDDTLRREILARREQAARQSPVLRHGARSMMRQIEEAERREQEAARARSASREGHRESGAGSGRTSPATLTSPAMSPSTPSTSHTVSTPPQEPQAEGQSTAASVSSYFDPRPAPPERVRSPLIPADMASTSRYVRPIATDVADPSSLSLASVAQSLEALASPASSPST
ncbi:hypothetical protein EX895_005102 [Sporisorium graminicola]|uniref:Uncharacterized protein n=1 Tax=Sporisorium graminicola TaxID=280036 RepID=A0A4U7KQU4_9BASI|nr:hypothetical protein EX895_005102 [Sporisorium graminicola]TKY86277.1 hypothetical protein EX895_005102 [Sporisorium graminicola]